METVLQRGELAQLDAELSRWPEIDPAPASGSTLVRRVRNACRDAALEDGAVGCGDLAALLRHLLRSAKVIGDPAVIGIPSDRVWPPDAELR